MTCSWVMPVAMSPKLVAAAIERSSVTLGLVSRKAVTTVSVLAHEDRALVRRFVKPAGDVVLDDDGRAVSIQGTPVVEGAGGVPRLAAALAWMACAVRPGADDGGADDRGESPVGGRGGGAASAGWWPRTMPPAAGRSSTA